MADWDRQEGEPSLWFDRFERYRRMGPDRSMLGCLRGEEAEKGRKKQSDRVPGAWNEAADKWQWKRRVTAWDTEQTRLIREAESDELEARRKAWISQARDVQDKGVERLAAMEATELTFKDVLAAIGDGMKLEMLARGQATDIHKHDHTGTITVEQRRSRLAAKLALLRERERTSRN